MYADKEKIEWLLFKSGLSITEIKNRSGVKAMTVSDLMHKKSSIERMRFDNAAKLTKLADQLKEEITE